MAQDPPPPPCKDTPRLTPGLYTLFVLFASQTGVVIALIRKKLHMAQVEFSKLKKNGKTFKIL